MSRNIKFFTLAVLLFVTSNTLFAQTNKSEPAKKNDSEDLMNILNQEPAKHEKEYTTGTFKSTRIANGQSIENLGAGILDFRISHRFGLINQGASSFWGLDGATTSLGFDYGITNWLMVGIQRSTYLKEYEGFLKAKILRQLDNGGMPVSVSYVGAVSVLSNAIPVYVPDTAKYYFSNRVAYMNQLLVARKMNNWLSLQLMPTHIHYNLVNYSGDPNDVIAMGIGGRIKLSNRIALTGEYYYQIPSTKQHSDVDPAKLNRNALTLGIDIETGGHVFQLLFTNAASISERTAIGQTTGDWSKGDIHFGFNISRVFTIVKPKEFENSRNSIY